MGWWDQQNHHKGGWQTGQQWGDYHKQQNKKKSRKTSTYSLCSCGQWHWDSRWVKYCNGCGGPIQPTLGTDQADNYRKPLVEAAGGEDTEKKDDEVHSGQWYCRSAGGAW